MHDVFLKVQGKKDISRMWEPLAGYPAWVVVSFQVLGGIVVKAQIGVAVLQPYFFLTEVPGLWENLPEKKQPPAFFHRGIPNV